MYDKLLKPRESFRITLYLYFLVRHNTTQAINDLKNLKYALGEPTFSQRIHCPFYIRYTASRLFVCLFLHLSYLLWLQKLQEILMSVRSVMRVSREDVKDKGKVIPLQARCGPEGG